MPFITANGKSIHYTDTPQSGTSPAKISLFLHGLGSSSCFFHTIIPTLKNYTRCIAIDYPGSGLSRLEAGTEQSIATLTRDIVGLLDALDVKQQITVVGHSMGGVLASALAVEDDRVANVVLIGPANISAAAADVFRKRIETVKKDGLEALADTIPTAATGSKSTALHHAFIRSLILGTSPEGYMSLCNVLATAQRPEYESIKASLLIIAGAEDKTASLDGCKAVFEAYGTESERKSLKVLDGIGHWHCVEAAEEVAKEIAAFIESH